MMKGDISHRCPVLYAVGTEDGKAVVLVFDERPYVFYNDWRDRHRSSWYNWYQTQDNNRSGREITKEEFETLGEICDLPIVDITKFEHWENKRDANSDTGSTSTSGHDTGEEPRKGLPGLYQRWRMFWLSFWVRPIRG